MTVDRLATVVLATLLGTTLVPWLDGAPWRFVLGPALAAGAPLAGIVHHSLTGSRPHHHPLAISVLSGLGCVITMVGIQRFGPAHDWLLPCAGAALAAWLLWQSRARRTAGSGPD
ncbi:MAG: hypothetical protein GVY11_05820 [Gammaproteobacteria bacterium]|nr:hypothetical protein [Gammaproteobacteria bacterium]